MSDNVKKILNIVSEKYDYAEYRHIFETNNLKMSYVSVFPGCEVPEHVHNDEEQTYIILDGEGEVTLGEERFSISSSYAVFIPAGVKHSVRNTGSKELKYVYFVAFIKNK
ncbi:MAG: cupin domain-containing protein [Sulfolobaceae archaeon]